MHWMQCQAFIVWMTLFVAPPIVLARPSSPEKPHVPVAMDFSRRQSYDGKSLIKLFFEISVSSLQFVNIGKHRLATYEIETYIFKENNDDLDLVRDKSKVYQVPYKKRWSPNSSEIQTMVFDLPPGKYWAKMIFWDKQTTNHYYWDFPFQIPYYEKSEVSVSEIIFKSEITTQNPNTPSKSSTTTFVPNVSRTFTFFKAEIPVYFELYGLKVGKPVMAWVQIRALNDQHLLIKRLNLESPKTTRWWYQPSIRIRNLPTGAYSLELIVVHNGKRIFTKKNFRITSDPFQDDVKDDERLAQIFSFADPLEIEEFMSSLLDREYLRPLLLDFWDRRDPTPETEINELRDEFYRRITKANVRFTKGWKGDQGKVYVNYGEPTKRERKLSKKGNGIFEIWHYPQVTFVFQRNDNRKGELFRQVAKYSSDGRISEHGPIPRPPSFEMETLKRASPE